MRSKSGVTVAVSVFAEAEKERSMLPAVAAIEDLRMWGRFISGLDLWVEN